MNRPCTSLQSVYYSTRGWFLKIFKWRICFPCNYLNPLLYCIVCRIPFSQDNVHLQSFTEQYFIVNKLFRENWVKFKIQTLPIHLHSESALHTLSVHSDQYIWRGSLDPAPLILLHYFGPPLLYHHFLKIPNLLK